MKIETKHVDLKKSDKEIFDYLADMSNFSELLQHEKIEVLETNNDSCLFNIKGMAKIGLKIKETQLPEKIHIESYGKVPFDFTITIFIKSTSENTSSAYLNFDGKINPFMKMMVEKPMTNFLNMLADRLEKIHG